MWLHTDSLFMTNIIYKSSFIYTFIRGLIIKNTNVSCWAVDIILTLFQIHVSDDDCWVKVSLFFVLFFSFKWDLFFSLLTQTEPHLYRRQTSEIRDKHIHFLFTSCLYPFFSELSLNMHFYMFCVRHKDEQ